MNVFNRAFFEMGYLYGFAAAQMTERKTRPPVKKENSVINQQDYLIADYISKYTEVYGADIIKMLQIEDNPGNQISVGYSMRRLGWIRRRSSDRGWYYVRGAKAV